MKSKKKGIKSSSKIKKKKVKILPKIKKKTIKIKKTKPKFKKPKVKKIKIKPLHKKKKKTIKIKSKVKKIKVKKPSKLHKKKKIKIQHKIKKIKKKSVYLIEEKNIEIPKEIEKEEETSSSTYDASKIQVLEGLESVRKNPGMYVGSTDERGLHHLVYEVVDNAIDEALAGYCTYVTVTLNKDGSVTVDDNGRGIPVDLHQKYKKPAVEVVMTVLYSGGKFDGKAYKVSGGLHGVGVSAVNALSSWLEVKVRRDQKEYFQRYQRGITACPLKLIGKSKENGTTVTFLPDSDIFETTEFDYETISTRLREVAFLNAGLQIEIFEQKSGKHEKFQFNGGVSEFVTYINRNKTALHPNPIYIQGEREGVQVEIALQYTDGYTENIFSFVNNINTVEGGTHVIGFKGALTRVLNDYCRKNKLFDSESGGLTGEDTREGITAIVSCKIFHPQFEGQTKAKLGNSEVKGIIESVLYEKLAEFFEETPVVARAIIDKAVLSNKAREAARKARELTRRKGLLESSALPGKLADCSSQDPSKTEIYIVEGDSAGGCFSGDTKIALLDGRNITFKQLVKEHKQGKRNFCYTIKKDGEIDIEEIKNPRITRKNTDVIKIILDNKEEIICTPNHLFMTRDGNYKKAKDLTSKDSLMPLKKQRNDKALLKFDTFIDRFFSGNLDAVTEAISNYNHRIADIIELDKKINVYDIEVPNTHNFALASGVFVHNSSKQGRNREFQAILPLRGKILNVEKAQMEKILKNNEILALITAIGTGIHEEFNIENARYHKIIIMTDADVDGEHIRTLLLTFFFRYMRPIIESGYLYIAQPPLYKLTKGKQIAYAYSERELIMKMKELGETGIGMQRYKGLGEMNPNQLWETTMDPENRTLLKVTIDDAVKADELFTILMGENVEPRREFIELHAKEVINLDI